MCRSCEATGDEAELLDVESGRGFLVSFLAVLIDETLSEVVSPSLISSPVESLTVSLESLNWWDKVLSSKVRIGLHYPNTPSELTSNKVQTTVAACKFNSTCR